MMKMKPEFITFSGVDDNVTRGQLRELHRFCVENDLTNRVEIGVLLSYNKPGHDRYPTIDWIRKFLSWSDIEKFNFKTSIHLCGADVFNVLLQDTNASKYLKEIISEFNRIQVNINAKTENFSPSEVQDVYGVLWELGVPHILQCHESVKTNIKCYLESLSKVDTPALRRVQILHDGSKGQGIVPDQWPNPSEVISELITNKDHHHYIKHGFAGGLSPANVIEQLNKVQLLNQKEFWLDMESGIRSPTIYESHFDILKVKQVLDQVYLSV